jgi:hypothetical protein
MDFRKSQMGEKIELKKSNVFLYCGFNLSLYGNNLEYKNNPIIKPFRASFKNKIILKYRLLIL